MSSLEQASEIQLRMYEFIVSYMKSEGMPPTNREIGRELKIASTGHVDYHLTMLEKKGFISRQAKKSRGIELIKSTVGVPVVGTIAAGEPLDIFPNTAQAVDVGRDLVENESTYALVVKGRSMIEDFICDGDYVVIKPQSTSQNGDIVVAVHMQGDSSGSATLKRFYQEEEHDRIRLQPANSELEPILISKSVWDREWQVQGKVVAIYRQINTDSDRATATSMRTSQKSEIESNALEGSKTTYSQYISDPLHQAHEPLEQETANISENRLESDGSGDTSKSSEALFDESSTQAPHVVCQNTFPSSDHNFSRHFIISSAKQASSDT